MIVAMKYRIRAFKHSDGRWEAKYVEPEGKLLAGSLVQIADSVRLGKYFKTEKEANDYTFLFLKERKGIVENQIEILNS